MAAFSNQIAVITGASSGVGRAIALSLAKEEASLCLVGRNLNSLDVVAKCARATAPYAHSYQTDLTQDKDIHELGARLKDHFGHIDLLIHSAGVIARGPFETLPVEEFDWQYRTNVRGPFLVTQTLLSLLKPCHGQIVFINSVVGLTGKAPLGGQYAATKHALKAFADNLREEVGLDAVRVLSVYLGRTATPMQAALHGIEGRAYHPERLVQPEDVAAIVIAALSLPRTAEVTDISIRPMPKPS
ncbi:MAG: SDR family oxidoreductase [Nitrospiraceae bacterium]